jgi:hypothetical protein
MRRRGVLAVTIGFVLAVSGAVAISYSTASGAAAPPVMSIGTASLSEGASSTRIMLFPVTLSAPATTVVSVKYAVVDGTAKLGDFTAATGKLTFPVGLTSHFVPVTLLGDKSVENTETFTVKLSSPVGATLGQTTGIGTIVNDDNGVCGKSAPHPAQYDSVVAFAFENRTWNTPGTATVGGRGFAGMPYLHGLAQTCTYFTDWTETDTTQNSMAQYVGQVTGARQPGTVNNCAPSPTCNTTADNIYRQARNRGKTAITFGEDRTTGCSSWPNALLWGADDRAFCNSQARPLSEFNPNSLPNFAFIIPNNCHNGHDCSNGVVDAWAKVHVQPVLNSTAYKAGKVAVFIWYDEDRPVPNMWITPTAHSGAVSTAGAGYAGTLKAWESMLGFPCLANACTAPDMRTPANS